VYAVEIDDDNGCTASASITITVHPLPTPDVTGDDEICDGDVATLSTGTYVSYQWYLDGNPIPGETNSTLNTDVSGTYAVMVVDDNGCSNISDDFVLTVHPLPNVTITPLGPTAFCPGGSVTLDAGTWSSYLWSTGETTQQITVSDAGLYTVLVQNAFGCFNTAEIEITVFDVPNVTITPDGPTAFCAGGSVGLDAGGPYASYQWYLNGNPLVGQTNQTLTASAGGVYAVEIDDDNGCTASASITVTVYPGMSFDVEIVHPSCGSCTNGQIVATATSGQSPFSYTLDGGSPTSGTFTGLGVGTYDIDGTDANGCTDTEEVELVVCDQPNIVAIDQISGSSARVRWNSEQPQPGAPYGRFWLEYRQIAPSVGSWMTTGSLTDTSYTILGLNSGYTYEVRVRYECSGGYSVWSNVSSFTTLANGCNAPNPVTTAPAGSGSRQINWGATPNAISYAVACGLVSVNPSTWPTVIVGAPTTTTTVTGLDPTKTHRARVLANCTSAFNNTVQGPGTSPWSLTSANFIPNTRLGYDQAQLESITLYPNPNNGSFNIVVKSAKAGTALLNLTDALGRTVYQTRFETVEGENQFPVTVP
ncbi:MAG: fibronectin type III domain-containing protein, partial [Bacteroidia bacterium]|nr:fibronectin type III domain-containing protein [Bacteroidia bacterium]